jgi:hypothetical protein
LNENSRFSTFQPASDHAPESILPCDYYGRAVQAEAGPGVTDVM